MMRRALLILPAAAVLMALASCTGRTMDNMEPDGETVQVVIPEVVGADDDSI